MSGVVCPQCGHDDRIQKVQAAVGGGISEVRSSGSFGGTTYSGSQWGAFGGSSATSGTATTLLAQRLLPPDEPQVKTQDMYVGVLYITLFFSGIYSLTICGITQGGDDALAAACFGLFSLLVFLIALRLLYRERRMIRRAKAQLPARMQAWEQAMNRWAGLYYCSRDDIVFDPETGESCHPADLHEFLYAGLRG